MQNVAGGQRKCTVALLLLCQCLHLVCVSAIINAQIVLRAWDHCSGTRVYVCVLQVLMQRSRLLGSWVAAACLCWMHHRTNW